MSEIWREKMALIMTATNDDKTESIINLVDLADPKNPEIIALGVERSLATSLPDIVTIFSSEAKKYYSILELESNFEELILTVDEDAFNEEGLSLTQLTKQGAERIANKIRRTKTIPCLIPESAQDTYNHPNWRKSFLYIPVALMGNKYLTPLVIEQNGIWAITDPDAEFELVANFENYKTITLDNYSPGDLANHFLSIVKKTKKTAIQNSNWLALSVGKEASGLEKYQLSFHEYLVDRELGNLFIVTKAIIDVWMPHVIASISRPAFSFDTRMFKHFDKIQDVIEWAVSNDTDEEKEVANYDISAGIEAFDSSNSDASVPLLDNPEFKTILGAAKAIAKASGGAELKILHFLCAFTLEKDDKVQFTDERVNQIIDLAKDNGIVLDNIKPAVNGETIPVEPELKRVIAKCKLKGLPKFALELLATLD